MKYLFDRMREPTTWTAVSALGILFGLPPGTVDLVVQVGVGVAGIAGVLMKEKAQ